MGLIVKWSFGVGVERSISKESAKPAEVKTNKNDFKEFCQKHRIVLIIGAIVLVSIAVVVIILFAMQVKPETGSTEVSGAEDIIAEAEEIDYSQPLTTAEGKEFSPVYNTESKADLSVRFSELTCNDATCSNVSDVQFGGKKLVRGQDFEVKRGSVIIIVFAKVVAEIPSGKHDLTFQIENDGKTQKVGIKIHVEAKPIVCEDNQELKDGKCVDKEEQKIEEKPTQTTEQTGQNSVSNQTQNKPATNASGDTQTNPQQPTTPQPDTAALKAACEAKTPPYYSFVVHWLSDAEKREYIAQGAPEEVELDGITIWWQTPDNVLSASFPNIKMSWQNDACVPDTTRAFAPAMGGDWSNRNDTLGCFDNMPFPKALLNNNPGKDMVVWYWRDGSYQVTYNSTKVLQDQQYSLQNYSSN